MNADRPPVPLSPDTAALVDRLFAAADRDAAKALLIETCGNNLPCLEELDAGGLERYRFAALRVAEGDPGELRKAIALARTDWRDLLMCAGFGYDVLAHEKWRDEVLAWASSAPLPGAPAIAARSRSRSKAS
jgi:hypothetical protein